MLSVEARDAPPGQEIYRGMRSEASHLGLAETGTQPPFQCEVITMLLQEKPTGFMRLWFRSPLVLYRLGLGWLAGHQFLLLTHRGRRTGLLRQTVLKSLHYDPTTGEVIVMAPLGERADWVRNIRHSPPLEVQIGRRRYVPTHRVLTEDETIRFLDALQRAHPVWSAIGTRALGLKAGQWSDITLVSFRPSKETALLAAAA